MDSRRSALLFICLSLVLCFWASSVLGQVLTTRSEFAASFIFDNVDAGQIGSFRSSYIQEDILILTTMKGMVLFDLANYNWINATANNTLGTRTMFFTAGNIVLIAPYFDASRGRIIVASRSAVNPELILVDFASLYPIQPWQLINETVGNPKPAPYLSAVFSMVASDKYLYYAVSSAQYAHLVRYSISKWSEEPVVLVLSPDSLFRSLARDSQTNFLYLGTTDGKITRVQTNDNDFANSNVVSIQVAKSTETIATIQVDPLRGYLYAATHGLSRNESSTLFRIALSKFSVVDQLVLDSLDFQVYTSAISNTEKGGILYLGTQQTPSRIIQIDLSRFVHEASYFLPDASSQGIDTSVVDLKRNVLWLGTIDPLTASPSAITVKGADLCLGDCFGRATCTDRTCSDCGSSEVDGVTLEWMQPWCQFLNCVDPTCSNNGQCHNATCLCDAEWTGFNCTIKQCPNNCTSSVQGTCLYDESNQPVRCECESDWQGIDCGTASNGTSIETIVNPSSSAMKSINVAFNAISLLALSFIFGR